MVAVHPPEVNAGTLLENSILKTLAWFDLFRYPVTKAEIISFLDQPAGSEAVGEALCRLLQQQRVYMPGSFYALHNDESMAHRRRKGNEKASGMLRKAYRIARLLHRFPFVRAVYISGSLSKHFADAGADIDFFIITRSNRLWIARTAMHLLKKLSYLWGGQLDYCMNYYIDQDALQISEQNYYTAIELITLIPVCGDDTTDCFGTANDWVRQYFPAALYGKTIYPDRRTHFVKRTIEWLVDRLPLIDMADDYLMKVTARRWKKLELAQRTNMHGGRLALASGKHYFKPNPHYFQREILERYRQKLQAVIG